MKKTAFKFSAVSFSYGSTPVLRDATFHIHCGEFAALIGPNGAGKTTILRLLLGLCRPSEGTVEVMGGDPAQFKSAIGYVPQHASFDPAFPISVYETVRMGCLHGVTGRYRKENKEKISRALELCDLSALTDRPYAALSGGQRRRVLVARALASEPSILILDEPTANMDTDSEKKLFRVLENLKGTTTILVVTHDTAFVSALTDTVLCVGNRADGNNGNPGEKAFGVVRHAAAPINSLPLEIFGGKALRVLHDTDLGHDQCCGQGDEP